MSFRLRDEMTRTEFEHSIASIKDKLFRFALKMMNNIEEAEDVLQEVLLKLWLQRKQLSEVKNLEAWSMHMTKNHAIDKLRCRKYEEGIDVLMALPTKDANPEDDLQHRDMMAYIENIMQQLPEKQRMVIHLRDIEAYSYEEIAQILDLPLNQVKVNLFRARTFLRTQLGSSMK